MKGYVIGRVNVTDPEQYKKYTAKTPASIASFGGRFVVRGGESTTVEGEEETSRIVVIEFDSFEQAKANDAELRENARAQLNWLYRASPHYEGTANRYPVYKSTNDRR